MEEVEWIHLHADGGAAAAGITGHRPGASAVPTIRLKLAKIGAQVHVTVRRVWVSLAEGCACREVFAQAYAQPSA
jgi:hypothetical protein